MRREAIHESAAAFADVLERARRRIRVRHVLRAAAIAALVAGAASLTLAVLGAQSSWRIVAAVVGSAVCGWAMLHLTRRQRTIGSAAAAIEGSDSSLRNLAVTAAQLLTTSPELTRPYMRERVFREASARTSAIDLRRAVPLTREIAALVAAVAVALALTLIRLPAVADARPTTASAPGAAAAASVTDVIVELVPPAYSGWRASRLVSPAALEVLAGTEAVIRAPGSAPRIRMNGSDVPLHPGGSARLVLHDSGYIAIDSGAVHLLVPLTVIPDAAPVVRITAPAKDLRLPSSATTIPIAASAVDDLALASLDVRYTVVSGSGEQFTFTEGTLPAAVQRASDRSWTLDATLPLSTLQLEPGDALIYRAVAADRRPGGAGIASSDTFFVEIAGPGDVPLEGVEMPPEKERYALSQAMIVLKLERLQARERSLSSTTLAEEAGTIAAEQRAVRANFIFLLGGEVEDEEVEAEHSHEISEGRFANQARRDIVAATVLMSHVEKALAAVSTREALPPARAAVKALQRAFGNSRYLLRALPSRVRLDPARRLTGDTSTAANWDRALAPPAPDPVAESSRAALAELLDVGAALGSDAPPSALSQTLRELGERILSAAARAPDLQPAAREIDTARTALSAGRIDAARAALRRAAPPLVKRAQQGRVDSDFVPRDAARLAGAAAIGRGGSR